MLIWLNVPNGHYRLADKPIVPLAWQCHDRKAYDAVTASDRVHPKFVTDLECDRAKDKRATRWVADEVVHR